MPRPPEPHYSFTIPSIHDDITLDCRIYHPDDLNHNQHHNTSSSVAESPIWKKRGLVMAHPYAPMGGSYDDRVVGMVVDEFTRAGWIVGTFNFRGAHSSKGSSSWSGRPELDDYISFAALFMHYMSYIEPFPPIDAPDTPNHSPISPQAYRQSLSPPSQEKQIPTIVLGGYSYGSLILKHLPPVPTILQPFSSPLTGSAADEILSRARSLAKESNTTWQQQAEKKEQEQKSRAHKTKCSLTIGGEETSPEKRRSSRDVRRSVDGRLSVEIGDRLRSLSHRGRKREHSATPPEHRIHDPITVPEVRYLLISPLAGPLSVLAAPALGGRLWRRRDATEECIGRYQTLALFGDQDIFTSAKKTRDWGEKLKASHGSNFSMVEVAGAGHFWVEAGAEEELRTALKNWEVTVR